MSIYSFAGLSLYEVIHVQAPFQRKVARGDTPGRPGGHQGRQWAAARKVTIHSVIPGVPGDGYDSLHGTFMTLCSKMHVAGVDRLFIRDGWFMYATLESATDTDRSVGYIEFDLVFSCEDPWYYRQIPPFGSSDTETSLPLTDSVAFSVLGDIGLGGDSGARMYIDFDFTSVPASPVSVVSASTGETLVLTPTATGVMTVDFGRRVASRGGTDVTGELDGEFFGLAPGSNTLTLPAGINSTTLRYREASA